MMRYRKGNNKQMGTPKFIFKSLYSNQVILDERKTKPWWLALIIAILALALTIIPTLVSGFTTNGSRALSMGSELSTSLSLFSHAAESEEGGNPFSINENMVLEVREGVITPNHISSGTEDPIKENVKPIYNITGDYVNAEGKKQIVTYLNVYYFPGLDPVKKSEDSSAVSKIISDVILVQDEKTNQYVNPPVSFLIMTDTAFIVYAFPLVNSTVDTKPLVTFQGTFQKLVGHAFPAVYNNGNNAEEWGYILDKSYEPIRFTSTLTQVGVTAAINAVVFVIVGILVFALTRGKANPYRDINFIDGLKISGFLSLSPGLLTCVLGFLSSSLAMMLFLMILGVRAMMLITRTSAAGRPGGSDDKVVYRARS